MVVSTWTSTPMIDIVALRALERAPRPSSKVLTSAFVNTIVTVRRGPSAVVWEHTEPVLARCCAGAAPHQR